MPPDSNECSGSREITEGDELDEIPTDWKVLNKQQTNEAFTETHSLWKKSDGTLVYTQFRTDVPPSDWSEKVKAVGDRISAKYTGNIAWDNVDRFNSNLGERISTYDRTILEQSYGDRVSNCAPRVVRGDSKNIRSIYPIDPFEWRVFLETNYLMVRSAAINAGLNKKEYRNTSFDQVVSELSAQSRVQFRFKLV